MLIQSLFATFSYKRMWIFAGMCLLYAVCGCIFWSRATKVERKAVRFEAAVPALKKGPAKCMPFEAAMIWSDLKWILEVDVELMDPGEVPGEDGGRAHVAPKQPAGALFVPVV